MLKQPNFELRWKKYVLDCFYIHYIGPSKIYFLIFIFTSLPPPPPNEKKELKGREQWKKKRGREGGIW